MIMRNTALNNIVSIHSKKEEVSFPQAIEMFLNMKRKSSENTATNYVGYYREFFMYTTGKKIDSLTWDDVLGINYARVLEYVEILQNTNSANTINIKLASLKSLYKELYKMDRRIDILIVDVPKVINNEEEKENLLEDKSWGSLTDDEIQALFNFCDTLSENEKPLVKRLFFETAYITALRKGALLDLKWKNIVQIEENGINIWTILTRHKKKNVKIALPDEFIEKLFELKKILHLDGYKDKEEDRVFYISDKILYKTLKNFCKCHGIDKGRNIVLHSLKKSSCDLVYDITKDPKATAKHGQHTSMDTTYKNYMGKNPPWLR